MFYTIMYIGMLRRILIVLIVYSTVVVNIMYYGVYAAYSVLGCVRRQYYRMACRTDICV